MLVQDFVGNKETGSWFVRWALHREEMQIIEMKTKKKLNFCNNYDIRALNHVPVDVKYIVLILVRDAFYNK